MKPFQYLLIFNILAFGFSPLLADTYTIVRQGGTIAPVKSLDISMDYEQIRLSAPSINYGYRVEALFHLKNHSDRTISSDVAFPLQESPSFLLQSGEPDFHVEIASGTQETTVFSPISFRVQTNSSAETTKEGYFDDAPREVLKYPKNAIWEMTWKPQELKIVKISYASESIAILPGSAMAFGRQFLYVVTTGNFWKNPIGKADIIFDFSFVKSEENSDWDKKPAIKESADIVEYSYANDAIFESPHILKWHFENWAPNDEIFLRFIDWQGVPDESAGRVYHFRLPENYTGNTTSYTVEAIDEFARHESVLAEKYYPERLDARVTVSLRIWIAEWLLREIYARKGISVESIKTESPIESFGWGLSFMAYGYHGGWYRPTKQLSEVSISKIERANIEFLEKYASRLRKSLETNSKPKSASPAAVSHDSHK